MKSSQLLTSLKVTLLLSIPLVHSQFAPKQCYQKPEGGDCKIVEWKYFYDATQNQCYGFRSGGCLANNNGDTNRFDSLSDCYTLCSQYPPVADPAAVAEGRPAAWAVDFAARGQARCAHEPPPYDLPDAACMTEHGYYWNMEIGHCLRYKKCFPPAHSSRTSPPGGDNFFADLSQCMLACAPRPPAVSEPEGSATSSSGRADADADAGDPCAAAVLHPDCLLAPVHAPGNTCKAAKERYTFSRNSNKCELFIYGGCNGTENLFLSLEDCEKKCSCPGVQRK